MFDFVRPAVADNMAIEPWYRYIVMFFAHDSVIGGLPANVLATRVPDNAAIRDYSPFAYRLRKMLLRSLPDGVVSALAVWKHRLAVRSLQRKSK